MIEFYIHERMFISYYKVYETFLKLYERMILKNNISLKFKINSDISIELFVFITGVFASIKLGLI